MLRHRIVTTGAQRLAAQQAPCRQQASPQRTEARDGNPCIIGTTGVKATTLSQQGAQAALVEGKQQKQESGQDIHAAETACGI
jgi:hypothetical protein